MWQFFKASPCLQFLTALIPRDYYWPFHFLFYAQSSAARQSYLILKQDRSFMYICQEIIMCIELFVNISRASGTNTIVL